VGSGSARMREPEPLIGSLILGVTLAFADFEAHSAGRALMPPAETELVPSFWEKYAASKPPKRAFRLSTRAHIYAAPQHVVMAEGFRSSPIGALSEVSGAGGPVLCKILDVNFAEYPFHEGG